MREISRLKKYKVADHYILGHSYKETEAETGVSHGSIVNIVKELESGRFTIPGTSLDRVNDLRQLSLDLKKEDLRPSQALLGIVAFERLRTLGISPEFLDDWSELMKRLAHPDSDPKEFFETALRLHDLEKSQGKPFEDLAEEHARLVKGADKLKAEVESLSKNKAELVKEVGPLRSEVETLEKTRSELENDVKIQTVNYQAVKIKAKEAEGERSRLDRETKDLERRKTKLASEVNGKEESLKRLNEIGLSSEDLLRLTAFIERTSKNEGLSNHQVKERFFAALSLYEDISGLENRRRTEAQQVKELIKKQSVLNGEILELEKRKGIIEGEIGDSVLTTSQMIKDVGEKAASQMQQQVNGIDDSVSSASQRITDMGEKAASQIQQQVDNINAQLDQLFEDTLRVGEMVGKMQQMVEKGEIAGKDLKDFLEEVRGRLGVK